MMNPTEKIQICLNALNEGIPVVIDDREFKRFVPGEVVKFPSDEIELDQYAILMKVVKQTSDDKIQCYVNPDLDINWLMNEFAKLPDDDIFVISANTAINKVKNL